MRSPSEIAFRLRQEFSNFAFYLKPPRWRGGELIALSLPSLPPIERPFSLPAPGSVQWRRDPEANIESALVYFRRVPYLDFAKVGDHKKIWDLNRHQELVAMAARGDFPLVTAHLEHWIRSNPVHHGINWTSALEVAFRALSWLYIWKFAAKSFPRTLRDSFLNMLYAHGAHLRYNLSIYFSPNTHLIGEAVALHALGLFFNRKDWCKLGRQTTLECLLGQVFTDGAYFEQSTYYHVYALDFFLLHHALEALPDSEFQILHRMGSFLQALLGQAGELTFFGDDDGGRVYPPFALHSLFGRHTLAQLWPRGAPALSTAPTLFPDTGLVFLANSEHQIIFDVGAFARGSAGHSHSDALSFTARRLDEEILIDPGTYTYVADTRQRDLFRSSAMHNTIRFNGLDQATPAGPFRWLDPPLVRLLSNADSEAVAECETYGFKHRRSLRWNVSEELLEVEDELSGPPGEHLIEQFWHFASASAVGRLQVSPQLGFRWEQRPELSFRSRSFGHREPSPTYSFGGKVLLPIILRARLYLGVNAKIPS